MREIKFRAWNEISSRMDNWCDLVDKNLRNIFIMKNHNGYELMQYTGLHDKNGKEIYEGDIVKAYFNKNDAYSINTLKLKKSVNKLGKIEYIVDGFCVYIPKFGEKIYPLSFFGDETIKQLEVIGNIYDNPELLKEDNK